MKDVVDDQRRRTVHETDHARKELRVAGISLECVALDNRRRAIPANRRTEAARTLGIVAENTSGNGRRGSEQHDTGSK